MAGTTSPLGFPYPTDSDLVQQVDESIQSLAEAVDDYLDGTGWTDLANTVTAGALQYRRRGSLVAVRFVAVAATNSGTLYTVTTANLPAALRPGKNSRGACDFSGYPGTMLVTPAGAVQVLHNSGAARAAVEGLVIYPAES